MLNYRIIKWLFSYALISFSASWKHARKGCSSIQTNPVLQAMITARWVTHLEIIVDWLNYSHLENLQIRTRLRCSCCLNRGSTWAIVTVTTRTCLSNPFSLQYHRCYCYCCLFKVFAMIFSWNVLSPAI